MSPSTIIVVPCYNEASRLPADVFRDHVEHVHDVQFLFVDDGSTDGTAALIRELAETKPGKFDALILPKNRGKAEAVRRGFLKAFESDPQLIGFWDADLATPLDEIASLRMLLEERPHVEMVFASRVNLLGRNVRRRLLRHYIGRVFATMAVAAIRVPIYDTQCGAKLFRVTETLRRIMERPFLSDWIFDVEIVARLVAERRGTEKPGPRDVICEHPLQVWSDVAGSKVRLRDFFIVGVDLMRIYWAYIRPGDLRR